MIIHDDIEEAFKPLKLCLSNNNVSKKDFKNALSNYMYMHHDKKGTYFYKHSMTRRYLIIDRNGILKQGVLDTSKW